MFALVAAVTVLGFAAHGYYFYMLIDEGKSAHKRRHAIFSLLLWVCAGYIVYLFITHYLIGNEAVSSTSSGEQLLHAWTLAAILASYVISLFAYMVKVPRAEWNPASVFMTVVAMGTAILAAHHAELAAQGWIRFPWLFLFGLYGAIWVASIFVYVRDRKAQKRRSANTADSNEGDAQEA